MINQPYPYGLSSDARKQWFALLEQVQDEPCLIKGKSPHHAVLVSQDDWESIQETLYLLSIPGMRDSLIQGREIPLSLCVELKP
jgi:antitoxin YefM